MNSASWIIATSLLGIFGSTLLWLYNELQKRVDKIIIEKESRYRILISSIRSFGVSTGIGDLNKKNIDANNFIVELQMCWMYCPDIVIKKGNNFLNLMRENPKTPELQPKIDIAKGDFVLEIRRDLLKSNSLFSLFSNSKKSTNLSIDDFMDVYYTSK